MKAHPSLKTSYIQSFRFQFESGSFPARDFKLETCISATLAREPEKKRALSGWLWKFEQSFFQFTIMGAEMHPDPQFADAIKRYAQDAGFDLCGIVSALDETTPPELEYFQRWIAEGQAGEMEYLKSRNDQGELKRAALRNAVPWVKSVVVCAMNYNANQPYSTKMSDPERGWISRYAWFQSSKSAGAKESSVASESGKTTADYHHAVLHRLRKVEAEIQRSWKASEVWRRYEDFGPSGARTGHPGEELQTRCYVDTGPIVERVYAKYAGIGWIGKNTCIINEKLGSWLFLGVILTSLDASQLGFTPRDGSNGGTQELPFDLPAADRCGSCTRCIDACPTGALTAPYKMDARKCIAYLTIEKRGEIPQELREQMGHHVFGCDICQDVCPWNIGYKRNEDSNGHEAQNGAHRAPTTNAAEFEARSDLVHPALRWLANMTPEEFNSVFRASPIQRTKYEGMRRNAAIAMGNSGNPEFIPDLEKLAQDSNAIVAEHARWALTKLFALH